MPDPTRGTVIFDLDGTLVDSAPDLADALDMLLTDMGLDPLGVDRVRQLIGHGMAELVRKGLIARGALPQPPELAQAVQRFTTYYTANLSRKSKAYPGATEVLNTLHLAGWRLVVCTNKLEASARRLLQDLGLLSAFAVVAGPDTFGVAKPHPAHLLGCLPPNNPASRPAVMIGDSEVDIAAAKAAGLPVIAVTWGYAQTSLYELAPDMVCNAMLDIPPQVEELIGQYPPFSLSS